MPLPCAGQRRRYRPTTGRPSPVSIEHQTTLLCPICVGFASSVRATRFIVLSPFCPNIFFSDRTVIIWLPRAVGGGRKRRWSDRYGRIVAVSGRALDDSVIARAEDVNDYPTAARAEYVFGCLKANGETRQAIEQCSCSIDVVASLVPYERYVTAETVLSMSQVGGTLAASSAPPNRRQVRSMISGVPRLKRK